MKILTVKKKAAEIMTLRPETRDSDFYLMYWVWRDEFDALDLANDHDLQFNKVNIVSVLSLLKEKKLSHPSGIMRARRKLQEEHPKLRGAVWEARHLEEENVKAALGYRPKEEQ